jgi:hypothetical protein
MSLLIKTDSLNITRLSYYSLCLHNDLSILKIFSLGQKQIFRLYDRSRDTLISQHVCLKFSTMAFIVADTNLVAYGA